jgi:cytochrome b561
VSAFLLVFARLAWRAMHRPPQLPAAMGPAARLLAQAGHGAIYLLLIAIPLSGWLMSSAKGFQTVYFGVLPIPDLIGRNKELGETLLHLHQALNVLLAVLVAGHSAAALKHHFIDHDDVLARMLPRRRA